MHGLLQFAFPASSSLWEHSALFSLRFFPLWPFSTCVTGTGYFVFVGGHRCLIYEGLHNKPALSPFLLTKWVNTREEKSLWRVGHTGAVWNGRCGGYSRGCLPRKHRQHFARFRQMISVPGISVVLNKTHEKLLCFFPTFYSNAILCWKLLRSHAPQVPFFKTGNISEWL